MDLNIYEVGPRDGLQNSKFSLTTEEKTRMVDELYHAGLKNIEIASFVNPKKVPNMADAEEIFESTRHLGDFDVLIPNSRGLDRAKAVGAKKFNVFFSHSDEFNMRNLGKGLEDVFAEQKYMLEDENKENIRAYLSCAFGCPIQGSPKEHKLLDAIKKADEIAGTVVLCDTIGAAHPTKMLQTLQLTKGIEAEVALHLHERKIGGNPIFGNVGAAVAWGVTNFDASIAGLGGCPFIPNSGSNLSTNALIHWANNRGYETGIELNDLLSVTSWLLNKKNHYEDLPPELIV
jgi:hydroxymethylglutaryl-CoA lyase